MSLLLLGIVMLLAVFWLPGWIESGETIKFRNDYVKDK